MIYPELRGSKARFIYLYPDVILLDLSAKADKSRAEYLPYIYRL